MIPFPQIGAMELHCRRQGPMVAWYAMALDADVIHRDAMHACLRLPGGSHLFLVDSGYGARPREAAGLSGLAIEFPSLGGLAETWRRLKQDCNCYPERATKNGLVTSLLYRDPDGNPLCLRYVLDSAGEPARDINPLGDEFDPALLLETVEA